VRMLRLRSVRDDAMVERLLIERQVRKVLDDPAKQYKNSLGMTP
jgi:hypothetical protein